MRAEPIKYKEGETYKIFRVGTRDLLVKITLREDFCKSSFDRMLFFKYNISPNSYTALKVSGGEENV